MGNSLFLPISREEMLARGWKGIDILLISGDAYVDHPAFGVAVIGRVLEAEGYRVAILPQPDWRYKDEFIQFGRPKLFVGITAGNLDSLLAHYSSAHIPRKVDAYSPGGQPGKRPDRATIVYANRVRECFPGIPIVLGGIEASLRRLAHYDYWSDSVRRSILVDSRANLIAYGLAEKAVKEIARRLAQGENPDSICDLPGTVWITSEKSRWPKERVMLPSEEEVKENKNKFAEAFRQWYQQLDPRQAKPVVQPSANRYIVQMPPALPLTREELDAIYRLPFTRQAHPIYESEGGVPALKTVETSITAHRGCGGGCAFCSLAVHQGRLVQSRSSDSVWEEVEFISRQNWFRGTITDIGGPTANLYGSICQKKAGCQRESCLYPSKCPYFSLNGSRHLSLLSLVSRIPRVKHVFVGTGIRHDLIFEDNCPDYLKELCRQYVGGHLKVAPEHICQPVLVCMRKRNHETFEMFRDKFKQAVRLSGKDLYLTPYFMSGHPACTVEHMVELAEYLYRFGYFLEQLQDFIPLPMTVSACIYHTGLDPLTGQEVYCCRGQEKNIQRALLQPSDPRNRKRLTPLLKKIGKPHLLKKPGGQGKSNRSEYQVRDVVY
ncbi:MAG: YgiQ family radical SAM protein [Candidatus Omnitrophica bacterium]|nr:YgiQ family radical SAM protein [Candidatus Omnitrophota bacterium]